GEGSKTRALFGRLKEHAESIAATSTLDLADFSCRYLVVDDIWIPLGESLLIAKFSPIWNTHIDGFGNHDPGKGRYQGMRPRWDVLHSGREWAQRCAPRPESAEQIASEVRAHLEQTQPPTHAHFYVEQPRGKYRVDSGA
ncbi:MAG TPA: Eco29kI family restriction endonuclease, partial [Burkholderiaceae bacterium]